MKHGLTGYRLHFLRALACVGFMPLSAQAVSCLPVSRTVADYMESRVPNPAIVQGTVTAVETRKEGDGMSLDIQVRATRWFKGEAQETIMVRGRVPDPTGPCHGIFNFSAKAGEQWLLFGQMIDGKLTPDTGLSIKTPEGQIPASVSDRLR